MIFMISFHVLPFVIIIRISFYYHAQQLIHRNQFDMFVPGSTWQVLTAFLKMYFHIVLVGNIFWVVKKHSVTETDDWLLLLDYRVKGFRRNMLERKIWPFLNFLQASLACHWLWCKPQTKPTQMPLNFNPLHSAWCNLGLKLNLWTGRRKFLQF